MSSPPISAFDATAAVFAVMRDDFEQARQIVAGMLPGERATLAGQLDTLSRLLTDRFGNDVGAATESR